MRKKTNYFMIILGLLFLASLLSGCGSAATDNSAVKGSAAQTDAKSQSGQNSDVEKTSEKFEGMLDLSKLHNDGYTADGVVPAGEHTVLISAVKFSNNVQNDADPGSTQMRLYAVNTDNGNIWDKYIEVGYVELSSHTNHLCDDGTTAVIETVGLKKNIVFVDAKSMTAQRVSMPSEDIWDVAVSPDKKKVAFTKFEGTFLSDLNFEKIELVLPRKVADPQDEMADELSKVSVFTDDSTQLFYCHVGYEANLGYGFYNVITRVNRFIELPDMAASMFNNGKLFISKINEHSPVGYVDVAETSNEIHKMNGLPKKSASYIETNAGGVLVGLIYQEENKSDVKIFDSAGTLLNEMSIENPYSNAVRLIEDQNIAVITTQEYVDGHSEIYIWRFR